MVFDFFHLFVKVGCPYCKMAIDLVEQQDVQYVVTVMDNSSGYHEMVKKSFCHPTVPIVLDCNSAGKMELVGGFTELEEFLSKRG